MGRIQGWRERLEIDTTFKPIMYPGRPSACLRETDKNHQRSMATAGVPSVVDNLCPTVDFVARPSIRRTAAVPVLTEIRIPQNRKNRATRSCRTGKQRVTSCCGFYAQKDL